MAFSSTLLAATTSATASTQFQLTQPSKGQIATISVNGLATTEKCYLQKYNLLSASFVNVKLNGSDVYCDLNNNLINVSMPGLYRLNKDATAGSVGVTIESDKDINIG